LAPIKSCNFFNFLVTYGQGAGGGCALLKRLLKRERAPRAVQFQIQTQASTQLPLGTAILHKVVTLFLYTSYKKIGFIWSSKGFRGLIIAYLSQITPPISVLQIATPSPMRQAATANVEAILEAVQPAACSVNNFKF
jgi:hypothetical protein